MTEPAAADGPPPPPTPGRSPVRDLVLTGAVVGGALALALIWIGRTDGPADLVVTGVDRPAALFAGDRACAECHPGESAYHRRSGHSRSLRPASDPTAARHLVGKVVEDPENGDAWSYALRDGRLVATRTPGSGDGGAAEEFLLDYAFGSGQHATTFASLTGPDPDHPSMLEHRMTYFAAKDAHGITPGQTKDTEIAPEELTPAGRALREQETLECFGCHATLTAAEGGRRVDPATLVPNVGCERCHGPGREHVEAARRGDPLPPMPFGSRSPTATDLQMRLCGQCHRHPDKAPAGSIHPDNPGIVRFQPVGLMQSACFARSPGGLKCTACHDPHDRTSTEPARYEAACLACHRAAPQAVCTVSPATGCVGCHMPLRDSGQEIPFHDHWIRVHPAPAAAE